MLVQGLTVQCLTRCRALKAAAATTRSTVNPGQTAFGVQPELPAPQVPWAHRAWLVDKVLWDT